MANVLLTFVAQVFVEAETDEEFQIKRDELLDELQAKGIVVKNPVTECGRYQYD